MSTNTYTNPYYNPNSELCLEVRQWLLDNPTNDPEAATGHGLPTWNKGMKGETEGWPKGKPRSKETRKKISEKLKGQKLTDETKKKMSIARKGQVPWNAGKAGTYESGPRSEETRKKISKSLMGNVPWNKGKKGSGTSNKTSFKKGNVPWNKGMKKESL